MYFFWVFVVFCYFYFLKFFYQNMGQKLGSNICPLFTMLTKQNIINVLHSKLVMKGKKMISLSWATCKKIDLFSRATCPHSHWSIFTGDLPTLTLVYFHGRPAHTHSLWSIFKGDRPTHIHPSLFSGATSPCTLTLVYFHGQPVTSHIERRVSRARAY